MRRSDGMPVEFSVTLQDRPGTLVRLGQMLGEAAVNIEAIQGTSREGHAFVRFVPRDPQQAARILDAAGIGYTQREVLIVKVLDKPIGGGRGSKQPRPALPAPPDLVLAPPPGEETLEGAPAVGGALG